MITGYSLYHLGDLEFEYDFSKLKPAPPPNINKGSLPQSLKEGRSPAIVLTESYDEAMEVVRTVESIKAANGDSTTVLSVKSVYSALPQDQDAKLALIADIRALLDREEGLFSDSERAKLDSLRPYLDVEKLTLYDLPADLTNEFKDKEGNILNFVAINAAVELKDGKDAIRFAEEISRIETPTGKTYIASSSHIIVAEMLKVMLEDSSLAVILTLAVVAVVLLIDLRSFVDTLLVLTPLLNALIWVVGFMYVFDIKLNLYNMVAFPTIIGMGIDNSVHIFHRYQEVGRGSLRLVLRTTGGRAVGYVADDDGRLLGLGAGHSPSTHVNRRTLAGGLGVLFYHVRHPAAGPAANPRAPHSLVGSGGNLAMRVGVECADPEADRQPSPGFLDQARAFVAQRLPALEGARLVGPRACL